MHTFRTASKTSILRNYQVAEVDFLGSGIEADVYALNEQCVLKLYQATVRRADLETLQTFYNSLDTCAVGYSFPQIYSIETTGDFIVTIEKRLYGENMQTVLPRLDDVSLLIMMQRYLDAVIALQRVQLAKPLKRYKLFDEYNISQTTDGDWHAFLWAYILKKIPELEAYFSKDVQQFQNKLSLIHAVLSQPYRGVYSVIHGDFFPGNVLVDQHYQVRGIVDFGLMTMIGDPLFDIATGWAFIDMYNLLHIDLPHRYFDVVINNLGTGIIGRLYRYVLIYSVVSANTYAKDCSDGHYRWCVANLNNVVYWSNLG